VITATYNWSSVLRYAIQSVLRQTCQDFEMIVVGDGCTDDSAEVVASFGDPRLRWHNLPHYTGHQSAPNNAGLELARGRYVAYLGHDDLWYPTHLAHLTGALARTEADVAYTVVELIGPPGSGIRNACGISASGQYEPGMALPPTSLAHRRALVAEIGGWTDYRRSRLAPDQDFIARAFAHGKRFTAVGELTVFKFPASWRPNSYRERRSDEQAEYTRRMQAEPDFLNRELLALASAYALNRANPGLIVHIPPRPHDSPPGWMIEQYRGLRGLEPNELSADLTSQRRLTRLISNPLRSLLSGALRWLGN
jgi:glycosyltransferase involved in cell wall biosynthesis